MTSRPDDRAETFQAQFHRRWHHLIDPHVRDLAWLLDAPDLLDPAAPQWRGLIATLPVNTSDEAMAWLLALDRAPAPLHAYLDMKAFTRLGRYAEKLMAFYFQHQGSLVAHGLQVRAGKNDTIGEFDFLLRQGGDLLHWEFATKFYLLTSGAGLQADYFIGPNLADTLDQKMRKILERQLILAQHPAAQIHLPQPIASAQALIKGWLFYHKQDQRPDRSLGLSESHCRGFWSTLEELDEVGGEHYAILPRLHWLAPARLTQEQAIGKPALREVLERHFANDTMPVLIAVLEPHGEALIETNRGFIVPSEWQHRAAEYRTKKH